jgi:predicted ATPase/DNA-binding SARP family transcriptional activator
VTTFETEGAKVPLLASAPLTITLFGAMQVHVDNRPLSRLRSRKSLWLLALLTLRHGRLIEREWLAGMLWPDTDQSRASRNLRVALSELRSVLGNQGERLETPDRHTLLLNLTGASVDVITFDAAIRQGTSAALESAVALYTGPLLEGCPEEWVPEEREAREQDCLHALQKLAETAAATGDSAAAISYWQRAVHISPLWDAARRGLMTTLSNSGDSNAALHVYRQFVTFLKSDPTALPDEKTTELYIRLRTAVRQRTGSAPAVTVPEKPVPTTVNGYLPSPLTELVGREEEREEVLALLRRSRLVTLTGPGGIGKTRLALAVAAEAAPAYADGAWLVSLETLSDSKLVLGQVMNVLRLPEKPGSSPLQNLTKTLRSKKLLLIVDNCEHLLEASAQAISALLRECAGLRVLATSREALGITGEAVWSVPALAVPALNHLPPGQTTRVRVLSGYDSIQLFVERAQAAQKSFTLTSDNAQPVALLCSHLEGIPLAIELAAARARSLTVAQIAARLPDYLNLLTSNNQAALPRQQTLRGALDWSYDLLSEPERALLRRLSVFAGGWTLEAAKQIGADDSACLSQGQSLDLLTGLVEKSLVIFEEKAEGCRYHLLEMVRQYASERLQNSGETEQIRARHRDWFLALAEEARPQLKGPEQDTWLRRLESEHDNLRAALKFCEAEPQGAPIGLRLCTALSRFWNTRGHYSEGRRYMEQALTRPDAQIVTTTRAHALHGAGILALNQSDYTTAQSLTTDSLHLFRELGDRQGIAQVLIDLANLANRQGDHSQARALLEESLKLFREVGERNGIALAIGNLGSLVRLLGDYATAQTLQEESLQIHREMQDKQRIALSLSNLGNLARLQGDYVKAQALLEESLQICRELGDRSVIAWCLSSLSAVLLVQEEFTAAYAVQEESLQIRRALGDQNRIAWSLSTMATIEIRRGNEVEAQGLAEESLHLFRKLGDRSGIAWMLTTLGTIANAQGNHASERALLTESLCLFREMKDKEGIEAGLRSLSGTMLAAAEPQRAARLGGAAEALRENIGAPLPRLDREEHDHQIGKMRLQLGNDAFTMMWAEGRALPWEKAVAYALNEEAEQD